MNRPVVRNLSFTEHDFTLDLLDGRRITVPYRWYPRLLRATAAEREAFEIVGDGIAVRWAAVDEDISVAGVLRGNPSPDAFREGLLDPGLFERPPDPGRPPDPIK